MNKRQHVISKVLPGSIAEEMEMEPGDCLITMNNKELEDVFDYQFFVHEEEIILLIEKENGEQWELEIEKEYDEDLGIEFENGLMDEYRTCHNKCVFCFIDQMPKGMRETLYFKDDDSRLSFLQGNYVTLTNMSEHDIDRIITYKLSPINISFHTTNPELRVKMLKNRFAGEALKIVDRFYEAGIVMNGQIVLCKGMNDGVELERTIRELSAYLPHLQSVSVVPVGLTKYRDQLQDLKPFTKEDAKAVLEVIENWQNKLFKEHGVHFIHAGDEWYILAEQEFPGEDTYDGYLQLENGVGMMRILLNEFEEAIKKSEPDDRKQKICIATGILAYPYIEKMTKQIMNRYSNRQITVYPIRNEFFGDRITVSGLLTGQDIKKQLMGKDLGDKLLLPCNVLRNGEDVFLDDMTLADLQSALQVKVDIVKSSGQDFLNACLDLEEERKGEHNE